MLVLLHRTLFKFHGVDNRMSFTNEPYTCDLAVRGCRAAASGVVDLNHETRHLSAARRSGTLPPKNNPAWVPKINKNTNQNEGVFAPPGAPAGSAVVNRRTWK